MKNLLIIIFVSLLLTSCGIFKNLGHSGKDVVTEKSSSKADFKKTPTMLLLDSVNKICPEQQFIRYHFKGNYQSNSKKLPIKGICAVRKDSAVWLSLRPGLGIEIARVYFFKDSLFILDRVQSIYYAHSYSDFDNLAAQNLSYNFFESLFSARPNFFKNRNEPDALHYEHTSEKDTISFIRTWSNNSKHKLILHPVGLLIKNSVIDTKNNFSFISDYLYTDFSHKQFPKEIRVNIITNTKLQALFKISYYNTELKKIPVLSIPDYYKKKKLNFK